MSGINLIPIGSAFLEGMGLILSPCILPILPIVLAASVDGGRRRPLGIITGFILAFTAFALLSRQILTWLHADPDILRDVALVLLMGFGVVMLSKKLSEKLIVATEGIANVGQNLASRWDQKNGYFSGVAVGGLIGLIWTPCAGPIMAAAVVQIIQAKTSLEVLLTVIMFALGAGVPMLLIALLGRQFMSRMSFLKTHSTAVRRTLGVVIILAAILIYKGADISLLSGSGSSPAAQQEATIMDGKLHKALDQPYTAPDITEFTKNQWFNSAPLVYNDIRARVVLVDFWTYSCINCVRTLPWLTKWDEKYRDKGLVIVGVHSPEFEFEKKPDNVKAAIEKYGIHYPVVLDNDLTIWNKFNNRFWPAHYLIDQYGKVVYTHFGEGDYDVTENNIRVLLNLGPEKPAAGATDNGKQPNQETPETYLGYARADALTTKTAVEKDAVAEFQAAYFVPQDHWTLGGRWRVESQKITAEEGGAVLRLNFKAKKVYLVMGTTNGKPQKVTLTLNDEALGYQSGKDVHDDTVTVDGHALYELVNRKDFENSLLQITTQGPGVELYAFTFGD